MKVSQLCLTLWDPMDCSPWLLILQVIGLEYEIPIQVPLNLGKEVILLQRPILFLVFFFLRNTGSLIVILRICSSLVCLASKSQSMILDIGFSASEH